MSINILHKGIMSVIYLSQMGRPHTGRLWLEDFISPTLEQTSLFY